MSMYAELLLSAQDGLREDLQGEALLCYVLDRRTELLASRPVTRASAISALAVEVAYDCALIRLCALKGIQALPADFSHPARDRSRLERELQRVGIDLSSLTRRWRGAQA
jgi:hypothetical protein